MKSIVQRIGPVEFAPPSDERVYMLPFLQADGLPFELRHWQPIVNQMLIGIETDAPVFFMLDQGRVLPNATLRRPGVHVDGHWIPSIQAHGWGNGRHGTPTSDGGGAHERPGGHGFPNTTYDPAPVPTKKPTKPKKPKRRSDGSYELNGEGYDEAIILASNVTGAIAYVGDYEAQYDDGNGVDKSAVQHMPTVVLEAGFAWAGNAGMVHESLPMTVACHRQVVRLNVPGWRPQ